VALVGATLLLALTAQLGADQVQMRNGDRYSGTVLALDAKTVVIQSQVLGKISLPRSQVQFVLVGSALPGTNAPRRRVAATNPPPAAVVRSGAPATPVLPANVAPTPDPDAELAAVLQQLGRNSNAVQDVKGRFLSDAGPEANQKFDELLSGLTTGKISLQDLRAQAKSVADQARAARRDLGSDSTGLDDLLVGYLSILDQFLEQTAPAQPAVTNRPARK
jgi:hypothetical protein